ncbi:MAG: transcriptional repressor [Deltaproteobacteria bacterium]|nr:transcriptional repressor [Deltaproteobacteria bacterium]
MRATLRGRGLRCTTSRLAVLELLGASRRPLSHGDVLAVLGARGFDRATLYRNLLDLVRAGLAVRADLGDHVWRFTLPSSKEKGERSHFLCTDCGDLVELPEIEQLLAEAPGLPRAARSAGISVQIRGRCDTCG